MKEERIETKVETLTPEKQEKYRRRVEDREEELKQEIFEKHLEKVSTQIRLDQEELNNFNVIVSGFKGQDDTDYTYIRTEPFIGLNKKNFDVLIGSRKKGIAVLVEYERTLAEGTDESVGKFKDRRDYVETGGDEDLDPESYLANAMGVEITDVDYALSSQHTPQDRLQASAGRKEVSFCVWDLGDFGVSCSIVYFPVKESESSPFDGHVDDDLEEYIFDELVGRVRKHDYLDFTWSSSNFLKLKEMAVVLVKRHHNKGNETFTFEDWNSLFSEQDIQLTNYTDNEKQRLYSKFISYGRDCNVVVLEEDFGDDLENGYRINTQITRNTEKLKEQIEEKIARFEMREDFDQAMNEAKLDIIEKLHSSQRTTLSDFME
jgi:hypothetical protein